jgi:DNA invertase Pin-like site-specific DNA recombinase
MNKKSVIYYRVSTSDQAERGFSLENQKDVCLKYADKEDFEVVKLFSDEGESAKTTDRPGLQDMLKFCATKKNNINFVVIYKLDRLTRNTQDFYEIKSFLKDLGINILSATEAINETSSGKFLGNIMASVAQLDNDMRSERVKQGMINCVESGRLPHRPPFGYINFTHPDGKKDIILDPERSELVQLVLTEFSKGIYLSEELRQKVTKLGLRNKTGKPISAQLIHKILNNKFYYGVIKYQEQEFIGSQPKMIDEGTYIKNQQLLRKTTKGDAESNARSTEDFPLRHLVICSFCGRPLTAGYSVGKMGGRYGYYRCYYKKCTATKAVAKDKLEDAFKLFLNDVTPKKQLLDAFKAVIIDVWQNRYKDINTIHNHILDEVGNLQSQKGKILDLIKKELISEADFKTEFAKVNDMIANKNLELDQSKLEEYDIDRAVNYVFDFITTLPEFWSRANYWQKLKLMGLIFPEKPVYNYLRFTTPRTSHIFQVKQYENTLSGASNNRSSTLVALRGIEPRFDG